MLKILLINSLVVVVVVLTHYEFLYHLSAYIPKMTIRHRLRILFGVFAALVAHTVEIWIFAGAYYIYIEVLGLGHMTGNVSDSVLMDCSYLSFIAFTTVGLGDLAPHGELRYLVGLEGLTGFVLITWTASFLYYEMQRHWGVR